MATPTQANQPIEILIPSLGKDVLLITSFRGEESLSRLFHFHVDMIADAKKEIAFDKVLGQKVTIRLTQATGKLRFISGICNRFSQGDGDADFTTYRLEFVPQFWLLTKRAQTRIFQQKSVPDILKKVLEGLDVSFQIEGTFQPRNYCSQYRETDFNFASRLMEEEGIYYFFTHTADGHKMVLANTPGSHPEMPLNPKLNFERKVASGFLQDRVLTWDKHQELVSGQFTLRDHKFEMPGKNLEAKKSVTDALQVGKVAHKVKAGSADSREVYDYPGDYANRFDGIDPGGGEQPAELGKILQDNVRVVAIRSDQEAVQSIEIQATSSCRNLFSGHKFTLQKHGNADGDYVITSVQHHATPPINYNAAPIADFRYVNSFTAIPLALPFRPQRTAPKPFVQGTQTAIVVGPKDEEIFCDKYGRVKVQFHWDREGQLDAKSSCWVRFATHWAGKNWGIIHIPRIGHEVVIGFEEGDPDLPIIIGSVYNLDNMPPYKLPDNKTQSGVKSRSTLKGTTENFNEIRFEDLKGKEHIVVHAERNLNITVEANERRTVGANQSTVVANNATVTVGTDPKGDPKKNGMVTTTIFGDTSTTITKGDLSLDVQTGKMTVHVKGVVTENFEDTLTTTGKNAVTLQSSDANVLIKAKSEIKLECGSSSISLKDDGTIEIKGVNIKINGSASVAVDSAKIDSVASAVHTIKGAPVKINC